MSGRTHGHQRWGWLAVLTTVALALGLLGLSLQTPATATVGTSTFDATDGTLDTGAGVHTIADEASGPKDNSFSGGGPKEDVACPSIDVDHSAPQNADIESFSYGTDASDPNVLYLAWSRYANNGTLTFDFELNRLENDAYTCTAPGAPTRSDDDLLVTYDFQGGTAVNPAIVIEVRKWTGSVWGAPLTLAAGSHEQSISGDLLFGEMAIDLVGSGILDPTVCNDFGDAWAKTRTGSTSAFDTSTIKDFVTPVATSISNCGSLTVTKTVVGPTNAADPTTFAYTASCTLTTLAAGDASFSLASGGTKVIDELPLGSVCTVTEADPGAGWTVTRSINGGAATASRVAVAPAIDLDGTTVAYTNTRSTGGLSVTKTVSGGSGETFAFTAACTGFTLAAGDASFNLVNGGTKNITGIPTGTSCTVTEVDPGATAWNTTISVNGAAATAGRSGSSTISGTTSTFAFTNTRLTGALTVTKTVVGPVNTADPTTFSFTLACSGYTPAAGDASFSLAGGATKTVSGIPTGTSCTVTETSPGAGWSTTRSIDGAAATSGSAGTVTMDANGESVAFTNTRALGSFTVSKTTTGGSGTFSFTASCTGFTLAAGDAAFSLSGGQSKVISGIPTGTSCTATETDPGAIWSTTFAVDGGAPQAGRTTSSTVDADGTTVAFTNVRNTGSLTITKTTTGGDGTFSFAVDCTDDRFDQTVTVTTTAGAGSSSTITGIPTTTTCTVTETVPAGWAAVGGASRAVTVNGAETTAFANRLLASGIDVTKTPSATTVHAGDAVTYTYVVTNPGENPLSTVTVTDDKCATVTGPAAGGDADADGKLDVGETWTYTCTATLNATTTNVVTATGVDPLAKTVSDTATATVVVIKPVIAIDKTPSAASVDPGTTVVYTYKVTNPGDVPLAAVTVTDDKCSPVTFASGDLNGDKLLQVGETWTFTCSQVQTGAADTLTNVGTARGTDVLGQVVSSTDTVTIAVVAPLVITQAPAPAPVAVAPVTLPRTGIEVRGWVELAGSLLLLGLALVFTSRRRRRTA